MSRYLPDDCRDDDPSAPWNWPDEPERESLGSNCCGALITENGCCKYCKRLCTEEFESDEEINSRLKLEYEMYLEGMAEAIIN